MNKIKYKEEKMKNKNEILYSFFRPIFTAIFKLYYNPIIINKHLNTLVDSGKLLSENKKYFFL